MVDRFPQTGDALAWLPAGGSIACFELLWLIMPTSPGFPIRVHKTKTRVPSLSAFGDKLPQPLVTVLSSLRRNRYHKPRPP